VILLTADELVATRSAPEVYREVFGKAPPSGMTDRDMISAAAARH
jgi:hypothetical protein